jgi:hypothetical protein
MYFLLSTTKVLPTLFAVHSGVVRQVQHDYVSMTSYYGRYLRFGVRSRVWSEKTPEPDPNRTRPQRGSGFSLRPKLDPGSGLGFGENGSELDWTGLRQP